MTAAGGTLLGFVTWDRDEPTGGNVYNRALITELRALGMDVRLQELAGPWPDGDASTHLALARSLRATPACLVDGIVASGSPDVVAAAVESGHAVTIVVHLPISDELSLEPAQRQRYALLESRAARASGVLCSAAGRRRAESPVRSGRCRRGDPRGHARRRGTGQSGFRASALLERRVADADQRPAHPGTRTGTACGPSWTADLIGSGPG